MDGPTSGEFEMTTVLNDGRIRFDNHADIDAVLNANDRRLPDSYKPAHFLCASCGQTLPMHDGVGGTGYAVDAHDDFRCYECCGKADAAILRDGKEPICLYLTRKGIGHYVVTNWPGTLEVFVDSIKETRQIVFGRNVTPRVHVRFSYQGVDWYGDCIGYMELCRCYPVGYHRKQRNRCGYV